MRFYALGVESNNDETAKGDYVYTATRLIVVEPKKAKKGQKLNVIDKGKELKKE